MTRLALLATLAVTTLLVEAPSALAAWTWPLQGEVVTTYRNGDDPYAAGQHRGIDIAGRTGEPVVAAVAGLVRFAGTAGSSGTTVSVRSEDGRFDVSYLHLASVAVRRGDRVEGGAQLGAVGTTGVRSIERPHLHFGVREAGSRHAYVDPLTLLPPPAAPAPRPPQAVPVAAPAPAQPRPAPAPAPRGPALRAPVPAVRPLPSLGPVPPPLPVAPAPRPEGGGEAPTPAPAARLAPTPVPHADGRALGAAPRDAESLAPDEARPAGTERPRSGRDGTDIGWLLACAGLLAAALALSSAGRRRTPRHSGLRTVACRRPRSLACAGRRRSLRPRHARFSHLSEGRAAPE